MQAVEIETIEADATLGGSVGVLGAEPAEKADHFAIAPHPSRKSREVVKRLFGGLIPAEQPHPAVRAICVRPVGLDGDGGEAAPLDEGTGQICTDPVELVGAVGRLTHEYERSGRIDRFAHLGPVAGDDDCPLGLPCDRRDGDRECGDWKERGGGE